MVMWWNLILVRCKSSISFCSTSMEDPATASVAWSTIEPMEYRVMVVDKVAVTTIANMIDAIIIKTMLRVFILLESSPVLVELLILSRPKMLKICTHWHTDNIVAIVNNLTI